MIFRSLSIQQRPALVKTQEGNLYNIPTWGFVISLLKMIFRGSWTFKSLNETELAVGKMRKKMLDKVHFANSSGSKGEKNNFP